MVTGYPRAHLHQDFTGCRRTSTVDNAAGADNEERGQPVYLCTRPRTSRSKEWPVLRNLNA